MSRSRGVWPRMAPSIYRHMLERVENAVTFDDLRAIRRFCRIRLENDGRLAELDEAIEKKAMRMIGEAEEAARSSR
jgi:hypothetical protein